MSEEANAALAWAELLAGLIAEIERLRTDNAAVQREWCGMVATRTELCRQLDLAHDEIATLRDAHAAVLAWLERYGALLPQVIRDELKEALNGS